MNPPTAYCQTLMTWQNKVLHIACVIMIIITSCRSHDISQNLDDTLIINRLASLHLWQAAQLELFDTITYTALPGSNVNSTDTLRAARAVRHTVMIHDAFTQAVDSTVRSAAHHQQRTDTRDSFPSRTSTRKFLFVFFLYTFLLVLVIYCFRKIS